MPLSEAHAFVTTVFQVTGRYPGLYGGQYIKEILGNTVDPILANCWLWIAQYAATAVIPPTWKNWTLWQYTDGAAGPNPIPVSGAGACDRDMLDASAAGVTADTTGLANFWAAQTSSA